MPKSSRWAISPVKRDECGWFIIKRREANPPNDDLMSTPLIEGDI